MAGHVSQVLRRVRLKARARGVPVAKLLPGAEGAVALLTGLVACWICWGIFKMAFLSYRAETGVDVVVADELAADAAAAAVGIVESEEFQKSWSVEIEQTRRRGVGGLRAEAGDKSVVLSCSGASSGDALGGVADARRLLKALPAPSLPPPGSEEDRAEVERRLEELKKQEAILAADRRKFELSPEERAASDRMEKQEDAAREQAKQDARKLEVREAEEGDNQEKLKGLRERLQSVGGPRELSKAELQQRRLERERLAALMDADAMHDSTDRHPVIKRIAELAREIERAELPGQIHRREVILAEIAGLRKAAEESAKAYDLLKIAREKAMNVDAGRRDKFEQADAEWTRVRAGITDAETTLKSILARPRPEVKFGTDRDIDVRLRGGFLFWPFLVGGLMLGLWIFALLHRRLTPMLSVVDSEEDLSECVRVAVLGKIPRLAALERH